MPTRPAVLDLLAGRGPDPLFLCGDAAEILASFPEASIDCVVTSPPYWGHREYAGGGLGGETTVAEYVAGLARVLAEVRRVLKPAGSLWLNLGDTYDKKGLSGVPWRVALHLTDVQGWVLRNSVVWNKVKGSPDPARDRLRNVHEMVFHFVRSARGYHYDTDAIRSRPRTTRVVNGAVVSATGVSGVRYRRQIELSTALDPAEKAAASAALDALLADVAAGRLADFRMILRGQQRATHSDATRKSGRARELAERGFCVLRYHPSGAMPSDVWDILPEDAPGRRDHFAPFPEDLCRIPILATCPPSGVVLDPFCGTGTACVAARRLGRRSVGIDVAEIYLASARTRAAAATPPHPPGGGSSSPRPSISSPGRS